MKVESKLVLDLLNKLPILFEDIVFTIRCGDDGFIHTVESQFQDIQDALKEFIAINLVDLAPPKSSVPVYVTKFDQKANQMSFESFQNYLDSGMNYNEHIQVFKAKLYGFVKESLHKRTDLAEVPNHKLFNWIECNIIIGSRYEKHFYSNEYFQASINVLKDIEQSIEEERKKAPQTKMF